jgi:hypothetical protein
MIIIRPFHFVLFIRPFQRKNFKIESKSLTSESKVSGTLFCHESKRFDFKVSTKKLQKGVCSES